MSESQNTLDLSGGRSFAAASPTTEIYADRPYERRLTEGGRKIISVDLDASLLAKVDRLRGKNRRGISLDRILMAGLAKIAEEGISMR